MAYSTFYSLGNFVFDRVPLLVITSNINILTKEHRLF